MQAPEDRLIEILKTAGVDFASSLPCEKVKTLLCRLNFLGMHVPLTREEEGVGISAGAALAGRRPMMVVQSSGVGNMLNALLSLTGFYGLPLAIFVSQRGIYKEGIAAQAPMGKMLPGILNGAGIPYTLIGGREEIEKIASPLKEVYAKGLLHAFLLSPAIWEGSSAAAVPEAANFIQTVPAPCSYEKKAPSHTRYEALKVIAPFLKGNVVVSNIGIPSKELYNLLPQGSNFYMLGSMGMASPIGLGVALCTKRKVFVIDGDGSILMNPGTLATIALMDPQNLTILAIDNGAYGSTGNQPTHARYVTDLSVVARGFGIREVEKASEEGEIIRALSSAPKGPRFLHIITRPGNAPVPNIPLSAGEIKRAFMEGLTPFNLRGD